MDSNFDDFIAAIKENKRICILMGKNNRLKVKTPSSLERWLN